MHHIPNPRGSTISLVELLIIKFFHIDCQNMGGFWLNWQES